MILVAGIGNMFLGDNAFGSAVARRMAQAQRPLPSNVRVVDFGTRVMDFVCRLMDGCDGTILVDATPQGGIPGMVYVIEPDLNELDDIRPELDTDTADTTDPMHVLALARSLGADLTNVRIVACEPETFGPAGKGQLGMSQCVASAVDQAIGIIEALVQEEPV